MHGFKNIAVLLAASTSLVHCLDDEEDRLDVTNRYIITLKDHVDMASHLDEVANLHNEMMLKRDGGESFEGVTHNYSIANFQAYAAHFDNSVMSTLSDHADIEHIEPESLWTTSDESEGDQLDSDVATPVETNVTVTSDGDEGGMTQQVKAPKGLRMISHRPPHMPNDQRYVFDPSAGDGTFAYIVDSGIYCLNNDFGGRARKGYNAIAPTKALSEWTDNTGHGTHVAGIVGGNHFGVAKRSQLIAVKVMNKEKSPISTILAGYTWAVHDITGKRRQPMAVVNIGVIGPASPAINRAIDAASASGVTTVTMAGNGARAINDLQHGKSAIRVSATNENYQKAPFANFGRNTDLYAPGVNIGSTLNGQKDAKGKMSGTAQASGFVSGLVLYFKKLNHLNDATATKAFVMAKAAKDVVPLPSGRKAPFAYNGSGK